MNHRTLLVDVSVDRVDKWVAGQIGALSRRQVVHCIKHGQVHVNGRPVKKGAMLVSGDQVDVYWDTAMGERQVVPNGTASLSVLFKDDHLLVVDKPAHVDCTVNGPDDRDTLANRVAGHFPECAQVGRPGDGGLLQRLDQGTSGTVIVARTQFAFDYLLAQQRAGGVKKGYLALIEGPRRSFPSRVCSGFGNKGGGAVKVVFSGDAHQDVRCSLLGRQLVVGAFNLVEVVIDKGARHQIRAHLAHLDAPLVGDDLYGGSVSFDLNRPALHAHWVEFEHPATGVLTRVRAPLAPDLLQLMTMAGAAVDDVLEFLEQDHG